MAEASGQSRLRATVEVVGLLAVVLSLVLVAFELRQNTQALRAQARQALAEGSREWLLAAANNPSMARSYVTRFGGGDDRFADVALSPLDSLEAQFLMQAAIRNVENVWMQYREGIVDESVLDTYAFRLRTYRTSGFRDFWNGYRESLDPDFVRAFEEANDLN